MALPTIASARTEITNLFKAYWAANAPALNDGHEPLVKYQDLIPDVEDVEDNVTGRPYAKFRINYNNPGPHTLNPIGSRRYTRNGVVSIQIFAPLESNGFTLCESLAVVARDALEGNGTATGIWFRNGRITYVEPSRSWYQANVLVDFQFDELR